MVAVPAASAAYIYVTVSYQATNLCRTAPDVVTYKLKFKAKIKRSGGEKPEKVRVGYREHTVEVKSSKPKISSPDTIPIVAQMNANPTIFPYCQ